MENINGRKLVEDGDLCERRNGSVWFVFNILRIHVMDWSIDILKCIMWLCGRKRS